MTRAAFRSHFANDEGGLSAALGYCDPRLGQGVVGVLVLPWS